MKIDFKSLIIGVLLCMVVTLCFAGTPTYRKFGAVQMKAIVKVIVVEFNRNRTWHGQPQITADQVRDQIDTETENLQSNLVNDVDLNWIVNQTGP